MTLLLSLGRSNCPYSCTKGYNLKEIDYLFSSIPMETRLEQEFRLERVSDHVPVVCEIDTREEVEMRRMPNRKHAKKVLEEMLKLSAPTIWDL
jgi:hypothetical protein